MIEDIKPVWFYEAILMTMRSNPRDTINMFDANLLEDVSVFVNVKNDYDRYIDDYSFGKSYQCLTQREVQISVTDIPKSPDYTPRFAPKDFMAYPDSLLLFGKSENLQEEPFTPFIFFRSMLEDIKYPHIRMRHSMYGQEYEKTWQTGNWDAHDEWYLIKPARTGYKHDNDVNTRSII